MNLYRISSYGSPPDLLPLGKVVPPLSKVFNIEKDKLHRNYKLHAWHNGHDKHFYINGDWI